MTCTINIKSSATLKNILYNIKIFDKDKCIYNFTTPNKIQVNLSKNKIYGIIITSLDPYLSGRVIGVITPNKYQEITYTVNYYSINNSRNFVAFTLDDQNYNGLKIERGKLILWPNHIQ